MKKFFISFSCTIILLSLIPGAAFGSWKWTYYFRRATIEGYVFLDKGPEEVATSGSANQELDRSRFVKEVLRRFKEERPIENATVSLGTTGLISQTDRYGYFRLKRWWVSARNKPITISSRGINFTFTPGLKDRLSNLFFIRIHRDGRGEVCTLERNTKKDDVINRVILVYGLGFEIGSFKPATDMNSWKSAYDLFRSDPDLSHFDFYCFEYQDDQNLVKSSFALACFLRLMRRVYDEKGKNILLAHSAGGLVVRHYTVSKRYLPGTVDRFLMLATPNFGSPAALLHFDTRNVFDSSEGIQSIANQILPDSRFLNCLNNRAEHFFECEEEFMVDKRLQDYRGLNPNIPCAILAGEVKNKLLQEFEKVGSEVQGLFYNWLGQRGEDWINEAQDTINIKILDKIPKGDILVSLKSQLIKDVPFCLLDYPHGFIHRPRNRQDERYLILKQYILTGVISEPRI